jgi:hypothetical protein
MVGLWILFGAFIVWGVGHFAALGYVVANGTHLTPRWVFRLYPWLND